MIKFEIFLNLFIHWSVGFGNVSLIFNRACIIINGLLDENVFWRTKRIER